MEVKRVDSFRVDKLTDGGYVVSEINPCYGSSPPRLASTTLSEALDFIRREFEPKGGK